MRSFHIPGVPPGREPEELARLEALVDDLRSYLAGAMPTEHQICSAPLISRWRPMIDRHSFRLAGQVENHNLIGPGPGVTSRVFAVDLGERWMRSYSRLWRLGECGRLDGGDG